MHRLWGEQGDPVSDSWPLAWPYRNIIRSPNRSYRIPGGFCQRKLLQIHHRIHRLHFYATTATGRGSIPRFYIVRDLTHNITLCRRRHHASEVWISLSRHALSAMYPGVNPVVWRSDAIPQVGLDGTDGLYGNDVSGWRVVKGIFQKLANIESFGIGRHFYRPNPSAQQRWWSRHVGCYARHVGCSMITWNAAAGRQILSERRNAVVCVFHCCFCCCAVMSSNRAVSQSEQGWHKAIKH
jgi:hypothetical protein